MLPGTWTSTATVSSSANDNNSANNSAAATVRVVEAPIVVSGPVTLSGRKQNNVTVATFTHAGGVHPANYYTATIHWGDGSTSKGTITQSGTTYTVKGSKTYANNGTYSVSTTVVRTLSDGSAPAAMLMASSDSGGGTAAAGVLPPGLSSINSVPQPLLETPSPAAARARGGNSAQSLDSRDEPAAIDEAFGELEASDLQPAFASALGGWL